MKKDRDEYTRNGFCIQKFSKTKTYDKFLLTLKNLASDTHELPPGFTWESKYLNTRDLRPNVFDLDAAFIDILSENKVYQKLCDMSGRSDLTLSHIQIRTSRSEQSYMNWHRDSYPVDGSWVGNNPPVHKLIFYPKVEEQRESLKLLAGSHNCIWSFQKSDDMIAPGLSNFDSQIFNLHPEFTYSSSDEDFIIFNTSALHAVVPDPPGKKSIRIIYSFVSRDQYLEKYSHKEHHKIVSEMFENIK